MGTGSEPGLDVVCVGETMVLLVPDPPVPPSEAATFRRDIGGAESNVAIHLARAGFRVAWHSALGDDAFGAYVRSRLVDEGVECVARTDESRPTGLYLKELGPWGTQVRYYRRESAASALTEADAEAVWRRRPRAVHATGITPVLSDSNASMMARLLSGGRSDALRSFDVNYRPSLHGSGSGEILRGLARRADVAFCGLDEAQALWGCASVEEVRELLDGPDVLVVKRGADGATAFRGGQRWDCPAPEVEVVESVGAGDAFAAGFLGCYLRDASVETCMAEAARLAGTVLQVHGDLTPTAG